MAVERVAGYNRTGPRWPTLYALPARLLSAGEKTLQSEHGALDQRGQAYGSCS